MKKYIFLLLGGLAINIVQSQEITDALRYSQDNLNGTARFRAMSGAFGALGGDLSAINVNPAGSAIFANNQVGVTLNNNSKTNNANYFGKTNSINNNSFTINQAGGVFVFKNQNNDWKKIAVAVNYENANNFDNATYAAGTNPTNSIDKYFLHYANGVPLDIVKNYNYNELNNGEQQAFLGYQAYIINPVSTNLNETQYTSNVRTGGNYYHQNTVTSTGYNGKLSFNAATQYKDKLYLGINLNSHFTDFRQTSSFKESNNNNLDAIDRVKSVAFNNDLYTYGTGFSFQLGAIAKVTNEVRLGLAYESPTWYNLNDELTQNLTAVSSSTLGELPADVVNPNITNVYEPYKLQTPGKLTGSFAYIFGKSGLISLDYTLKNYGATQFQPVTDSYFKGINSEMSNTLRNKAGELKLGAEYKINQWSLRGGYHLEQSPYKNTAIIGDLTGYSAGLGYNFGATKLDLAYSTAKRDSQQGFFSQVFTDGAKINATNNVFTMTLLFEM